MTRGTQLAAIGTLTALALLAGSGLPATAPTVAGEPAPPAGPDTRLVAYESCHEALAGLRAAATAAVGPWGLPGGGSSVLATTTDARAAEFRTASAPEHSTTNVHEVGVDEPDLVKTDGRRIVTVSRGVLQVTDPATRQITGRLDLAEGTSPDHLRERTLLLLGDRALVLSGPARVGIRPVEGQAASRATVLTLVDLTSAPAVLGTYSIDGTLVDARQTGATARVAIRSAPRLDRRPDPRAGDAERIAANRAVIAAAGIEAWLPAYRWTAGAERHSGRVGCDQLSRPADATGNSVVTVLSFDLAAERLGDGDPVSLVADAATLYGTANNLWLAGWRGPGEGARPTWWGGRSGASTVLHQFDTSGPGRPRYLASGSVPGWLVNQYALSEWQGDLRVATTVDSVPGRQTSESAVYVLRRQGGTLKQVGAVTGLGRGERIHSVRFLGGTGHVVTFRQTDPLYTLDLTDPAAPRVTGELKITGYSAYLHPLPDGRLLGVGQEADERGRTRGLQVSLFDVRDPARPVRLDRYHVPRAQSAAEFDPHAFLYHPETGLVALPVDRGIRLLRVSATGISEIGQVTHPGADGASLDRSLLVDGTLWTVSAAGLRASDPDSGRSLAWLPST
ncbi:beta-propeller domain-containing protein [Micromonospora avicenniae]|uniref:Secreted protein containing C-terminal beta-propeller domain n=1 Tax=Micromonospora avicenniae TaxID=1198245 RepID=A0A1N6TLU8_9ACTN|nr:beta-propeller domain-containing protein [Micromonospora avicenniae]SIQ54227.1 Secreted protein containing C-terminal beta-propeller domain [Micromonospora avicenniae]